MPSFLFPSTPMTPFAVFFGGNSVFFGGNSAVITRQWGTNATVGGNATIEALISKGERISLDRRTLESEETERLAAIGELVQSLPPQEVLIRWATENPPPQSWFDEDDDLL